jgi:hypothetical protein
MLFAMVIRIPETNRNSQSTETPDMMPYQTLRPLGVGVPRCRSVRLSCLIRERLRPIGNEPPR